MNVPQCWVTRTSPIMLHYIYTPCYVSSDEKETESAAGKTEYQVTTYIVRTVHEVDRFTKIPTGYKVLISRKLYYLATL